MYRFFTRISGFRARHRQVSLSGLQRCHINHKAVFHITFQHAFIRFINILNLNHFDIGSDAMLATEIKHFLGFGDAADERAGEAAASEQQTEGGDGERLRRRADKGEITIQAEQVDIGIDIVIGGDGIEDEVEAAGVLLHLVGMTRDHGFVGAEAERVFLLAGRGGEDDDVSSECLRKLHAHVTQTAETHHTDFFALGDAPAAHGRIGGNSGALERCRPGKIEVGRDAQDKTFIDDDALGVAAIGDALRGACQGN